MIRRATISTYRSSDDLCLHELIEAGELSPVLDACYSLDEIVDALRYVDQGHKKGNVVITNPVSIPSTKEGGHSLQSRAYS